MPVEDYRGGSSASLGLHGRGSIHSTMGGGGLEQELEVFQRRVAALFHDLAGGGDEILSISWVRKLLDAFLACQEDFRSMLFKHRAAVARPPLDRLVADYMDRGVKALDVCNAIRDGIGQIRLWQKHLEIVLDALGGGGGGGGERVVGEGQVRRARKALTDLTILMLDEKEAPSALAHRNRSFGRSSGRGGGGDHHRSSPGRSSASGGQFRSLSWSVSRSWSAARQLQALGNNLSAPRGHEVVATGGLATPVYTMASVLFFVMWALVAAIPCQDRGLQTHFSAPRSLPWATPMLSLHERIAEESKKKERRNSNGLLKEIHRIERLTHRLSELIDGIQLPMAREKEAEVRHDLGQLSQVYEAMKEGLNQLDRQVREAFHGLVRGRTEGLDCFSRNGE